MNTRAWVGGERVHEVSTPERTRKVPTSDSENAEIASSTVQFLNAPALLGHGQRMQQRGATSHGMNEAFSTGSQNHQPPQPACSTPTSCPIMMRW